MRAALRAGTAALNGGVFQNNSTLGPGGGLDVIGALSVTGTQFVSNTAGNWGGGLFAQGDATLNGASFISNTAANSHGGETRAPAAAYQDFGPRRREQAFERLHAGERQAEQAWRHERHQPADPDDALLEIGG